MNMVMHPGGDFDDRLAEVHEMSLILHRPQHRILKELPLVRDLDPVDHMAL